MLGAVYVTVIFGVVALVIETDVMVGMPGITDAAVGVTGPF